MTYTPSTLESVDEDRREPDEADTSDAKPLGMMTPMIFDPSSPAADAPAVFKARSGRGVAAQATMPLGHDGPLRRRVSQRSPVTYPPVL